jgi:glycosyltransferase involved in cell wall biosynthesis
MKSISKSFSIIIIGNGDGLEKTINSIAEQTVRDIQVIFLNNIELDARNYFSKKYNHIQFDFVDNSHPVYPGFLEKVNSPFAVCLATNELLLTATAIEEYQYAFEENSYAQLIVPNIVLTNSIGEIVEIKAIGKNRLFSTSDLLSPIGFRSDGRGIAFRVPKDIRSLPESLIEILITLSQRGDIVPLDANLHSLDEETLPSLMGHKLCFKKIWWNYLFLEKEKGSFSILSNYYNTITKNISYSSSKKYIYKIIGLLLYPKPFIKSVADNFVWIISFCIYELLGVLGRILFCVSTLGNGNQKVKDKFALISHVLPPSASGQSVVIERLLRDVPEEQYTLINSRPIYLTNNLINPLPSKIHHLKNVLKAERFHRFSLLYFFANFAKSFLRGWQIAKVICRENCEILIGCSGDLYDLPATFFASCFTRTKFFGYYFDDYQFQWVDKKQRLFASKSEKYLLGKMEGLIVPNKSLQNKILERKYIRTIIVSNPADDTLISTKIRKLAPPYQIVYTGSVYHVNIEAIRNVISALDLIEGKQIELHIYTSQPRDLLQSFNISGKNVIYNFHVPPEEIAKIQNNAFLLLVPFSNNSPIPEVIHTSAPGKLGDYLVSGVPILAVAPSDSFIAKFLKSNNCGSVVSSHNPRLIARQIINLLESGNTRKKLVLNASQVAKKQFNRIDSQKEFLGFILDNHEKPGILHISATDLVGKEFNGFTLGERIRENRFNSYMSIAQARSMSPYVYEFGHGAYIKPFESLIRYILKNLSIQSLFPFYVKNRIFPSNLLESEIDIIHLQLIHSAPFFNLRILPKLSRNFPTVYTLHDQWAYTGHCIHPLECQGWLSGCQSCPYLERSIKMKDDRAAFMYQQKQKIFSKSKLNLIVSSQWMYDRVKKSPIMSHLPCTIIPFGIDQNIFYPEDKILVRKALNIPVKNKVIIFRSSPHSEYKGMQYIQEALRYINPMNITILATDVLGGLEDFKEKFQILELGWVNDQTLLRKYLSAADVFLSPSLAESFGMMPLEAMACGTPTIVFKDTALENITCTPTIGIAVEYRDGQALGRAVEQLFNDPEELLRRSDAGIKFVKEKYTIEQYVEKHIHLYNSLI